jgi:ELWxxDGT repeat protein
MARTSTGRSGVRTLAGLAACGLASSAALGDNPTTIAGSPLTYGRVVRLADTTPGTASGLSTTAFVPVDNEVYFRALADGGSLWRSNGRPGGTIRLDTGVLYDPIVVGNSVVYLRGGTSTLGAPGMCVAIAGSNSPTLVVPGAAQLPYTLLRADTGNVRVAGTKVFYAQGVENSSAIWSWDWLTGAQEQLTFPTGTGYTIAREVVIVGSKAFILGQNASGYGLWSSDGTAAGTIRATALTSLPYSTSTAPALGSDGSRVYFTQSGTGGYKLWTSDGTAAGTFMVGPVPTSTPTSLWSAEGASGVYWGGNATGTTGSITQLWHFSPTAGGAEQLLNFPAGTSLASLGSGQGASVFVDFVGTAGYYSTAGTKTLWVTFGTQATTLVGPQGVVTSTTTSQIPVGATTSPLSAAAGSEVFFVRTSTSSGTELWHVNVATGAMGMVADLAPGTASSNPTNVIGLQGGRGAAVFGQSPQLRLWTVSTDGSRVRYLSMPTAPSTLSRPVSVGNRVFMALSSSGGVEPWAADLCPADYDNSGTVTTQDLFAFLNDWLAADKNAIWDTSNGSPTIGDLYGYLNAWISGCP